MIRKLLGNGLRSQWIRASGILLVSVMVAQSIQMGGIMRTLDHLYSDAWHRFAGPRHEAEHVALVVVDEPTLRAHEGQPLVFWTPLFARVIQTLRDVEASVIGIDFLFSISPETWMRSLDIPVGPELRNYDLAFRQQLNAGNVLLVGSRVPDAASGMDSLLLPAQDYLFSLPDFDIAAHVALADLQPDADGGIREYEIAPHLNLPQALRAGAPRFSMGALLAIRASGQRIEDSEWNFAGHTIADTHRGKIGFVGPPGSIPSVSMSALLADQAHLDPAVQALRGKAVIIGGDYQGMGDVHFTPHSRALLGSAGALMTGPEIQANIAETLLSGRELRPVAQLPRLAIWIILLLTACMLFQLLAPLPGLLALGSWFLLGALSAWLAFVSSHLLPIASLQIGLIVAYVLTYGSRLTRQQREEARIRRTFDRYVSGNVVEKLLESENLPRLGGEKVEISILFSDIRNFTGISEQLDPQEVVEFLNEYFERVCNPILELGGTIDKFIGDAVMVQFGAPCPYPDHANRALEAALAMREQAIGFRTWMRQRFPTKVLPEFDIGIGIHSGPAVVGNVGSSRRTEYTAIGDAVNLASRLEGVTKRFGCMILASEATIRAAGEGIKVGRSERVQVKGRKEPVQVYEVFDVKSDKGKPAC